MPAKPAVLLCHFWPYSSLLVARVWYSNRGLCVTCFTVSLHLINLCLPGRREEITGSAWSGSPLNSLPCADRGLFLSLVRDTVGDTWGTVKWLYVICLKNSSCHFEIQFPVRSLCWAFFLSSSEGSSVTSPHTSLEITFQVTLYPWTGTLGWPQSPKSRARLVKKVVSTRWRAVCLSAITGDLGDLKSLCPMRFDKFAVLMWPRIFELFCVSPLNLINVITCFLPQTCLYLWELMTHCTWGEERKKFLLILSLGWAGQWAASSIPTYLIKVAVVLMVSCLFTWGCMLVPCAASEIGTVILLIVLITHALHLI